MPTMATVGFGSNASLEFGAKPWKSLADPPRHAAHGAHVNLLSKGQVTLLTRVTSSIAMHYGACD